MYDPISGREGFEVLSDKIVFEGGESWKFDGSSESLKFYSHAKGETLSFSSKEESDSEEIEKEADLWMSRAVSGSAARRVDIQDTTD